MRENWELAIESTAPRVSVALGFGGAVVWGAQVLAGRKPSEVLMNPLREGLGEIPAGGRLGVVVAGMGPGSYNGARVGIAAGQGIGMVRGCAAVGVCSLEALETTRSGGRCLAVGDARRGTFFAVPVEGGRVAGVVELLEGPGFVARVEEAVRDGRQLVTLEEVERLCLPEELAAAVRCEVPQARLLLEAWWARGEEEREALRAVPPEPFYLREAYVTTAKKG